MGAAQSQTAEPTVVRIGRDEIPEEYRNVGVSGDVVQRVLTQSGTSSSADNEVLRFSSSFHNFTTSLEMSWSVRKRRRRVCARKWSV